MQEPDDFTPENQALPPLAKSFPNSAKALRGELEVPEREITLTNGETVTLYDATGPQGHDLRTGLLGEFVEVVRAVG